MDNTVFTVLVAEDSDDIRKQTTNFLRQEGYNVLETANGQATLDCLRRNDVDLLLLDNVLPDMSGYEVIEALKAEDERHHIPVIMISDDDDVKKIVRFIEIGAVDHLPKRFEPVLLKARIEASLEKKRHFEEMSREKKLSNDLLNIVIPVGVALSATPDLGHLLETLLTQAKSWCNADAGTIYLRTAADKLSFVVARIKSQDVTMGGATDNEVPFPPLNLYVDGRPDKRSVAGYVAATGTIRNIPDVYADSEIGPQSTREFDRKLNYECKSMLAIPLKTIDDDVIGVLQLINAVDARTGNIIPFGKPVQHMLEAMSSLAAAALLTYKKEHCLQTKIRELEIEIDEFKCSQQVKEITESPYFEEVLKKMEEFG